MEVLSHYLLRPLAQAPAAKGVGAAAAAVEQLLQRLLYEVASQMTAQD